MSTAGQIGSWLRCYRCWSRDLEVQVHYEGIHRIDPVTGKRADVDGNMTAAAQALSDKDIEVLADYIAGLGG